jgi:hypothetical protein
MNSCPPPVGNAEWDAWKATLDKMLAEYSAWTEGFTKNRFSSKSEFFRMEIAKQRAREPLTRCRIELQKAGRKISDTAAVLEIRSVWTKEAKAWKDRATHAERNKNIKIGLAVVTIATAGTAAIAAAAGAGGLTSAAGLQAAAGSLVGAAPGATLKQIGTVALKKYAIKFGTEQAVGYAANEYAKYTQKKMTKAQEKTLAREMAAAEKEYAELIAKGAPPDDALISASVKPASGGIIPIGLLVLAAKYAMG